MHIRSLFITIASLGTSASTLPANNGSVPILEIHYAARHFTPDTIEVSVGQAIDLRVVNDSAERIEFESFMLHREKVIEAGATLVVHLPPLKTGAYDFFDDFHDDVRDGRIVAR